MKNILLGFALMAMSTLTAQTSTSLLPLQGTWEGTVNGNRYVEQWTCANGVCDGSATSYRGATVSMTETTRIMEFAGHWLYLVWVGEGPAVAFTRTIANDSTWTFENKEHDFPQRISYTVSGKLELPYTESILLELSLLHFLLLQESLEPITWGNEKAWYSTVIYKEGLYD